MVRFQVLTAAAALGVMLSAQAQGNIGDQHLALNPHPLRSRKRRQFGATRSGTSNGPSGG